MTDSVIDFLEKRNEAIEQRRREFERILFKNFLGVYLVVEDEVSTFNVEMVDISDKGCLLQLPLIKDGRQNYQRGNDLYLRLYFTPTSYLPITVTIKYHSEFIDSDGAKYQRYGCEFDREGASFEAIESFVQFITKFSELSYTDRSDSRQSVG
jgi:hypothetical protein